MTCDVWRDQITSYVDGELAPSHDEEVTKHLKQCGDCTLYAVGEIQLKRAVSNAARRYKPSQEFRAKVIGTFGTSASRRFFVPLAVAAILVFAVASGLLVMMRASRANTGREIVDVHLSTIASANPVDVVSSDMHTVKPWFQGKVPFTFNLPELQNSPFTLLGGRLVYLHETPMALLLFQYKLHRISVLVGPTRVLSDSPRDLPGGFHSITWTTHNYRYTTIGDASPDVLQDLSQRMRTVAE